MSASCSSIIDWKSHAHLSTPAHAQDTPCLDPGLETVNCLHYFRDLLRIVIRVGRPSEECAQLLAFLIVVRWVPFLARGLPIEEVGHEDLVFLIPGVGENIRALQGLREEAEDVEDDEYAFGGVGRTSCVC